MYRVNFLNSSCTSSFMLRFPNPKSLENKILLYTNLVQVQMPRFPNPKYLENKILLYIYLVLVQMPRFPNPKSPESQILLYILLAQVSEISGQSHITIHSSCTGSFMLRFPSPKSLDSQLLLYSSKFVVSTHMTPGTINMVTVPK